MLRDSNWRCGRASSNTNSRLGSEADAETRCSPRTFANSPIHWWLIKIDPRASDRAAQMLLTAGNP